jgi:metallo-beta-lactamase family protein
MKLTFLGATGTVTGSKYLVESGRARVLVDCGLFQGVKALRQRNWDELPFEPSSLDAIVLTHAHIDHSGYLPVLVKRGFTGKVYCTPGTRALCGVLLPDSGHLQEEAANYANRKGFSKHHPALPLYTELEARESLRNLRPHAFDEEFQVAQGLTCRFSRAGHILGSACVYLSNGSTTLGFSGDVGRPVNPVLRPPEPLRAVDYLVMESTYGNRLHPEGDPAALLAEVVRTTWERGGVVLIPSFAVGRAQAVLHLLAKLRTAGELPPHPIFLDSPMAIDATELYCGHLSESRLPEPETRAMCGAARFLRTPEESMSLNTMEGPLLIVSASGMATGGRVLHHLKRLLPGSKNTVLFVGFQAAGTRGEALTSGASEVKIHGSYVPVRAEVRSLDALSAHGDRAELIEWLRKTPRPPQRTFVTHGEPAASDAFRRYLRDALGWEVVVPSDGQQVTLT